MVRKKVVVTEPTDADRDFTIRQFGECRTRGHRWALVTQEWTRKRKVGARFRVTEMMWTESCPCGAERRSHYEVNGKLLTLAKARTTVYPAGYALKGGRMTRAEAMYRKIEMDHPELILG